MFERFCNGYFITCPESDMLDEFIFYIYVENNLRRQHTQGPLRRLGAEGSSWPWVLCVDELIKVW